MFYCTHSFSIISVIKTMIIWESMLDLLFHSSIHTSLLLYQFLYHWQRNFTRCRLHNEGYTSIKLYKSARTEHQLPINTSSSPFFNQRHLLAAVSSPKQLLYVLGTSVATACVFFFPVFYFQVVFVNTDFRCHYRWHRIANDCW